ncbi:cupin domain-containing protein [Ovoidimarina sediminis]|uniref:cupin n=1 Tax=Ovoidimarina sediminis TaxID=3079856 RepID=UPI00290EE2A2|nr:cupin [Rhodophyticola sp. MJ-SS7]MDU8943850.1 cupin [Rhodophyticola sp. MJ-SS7]
MHYHHLYMDAGGESRWKDVDIALEVKTFAPPAQSIEISEGRASRNMLFLRLRAGWNEPVHPTPIRQTLVCLRCAVRVTSSDGDIRDIGPGDLWLMEDTGGRGHHTEVTSADDFEAVIVQHD